MTAFEISKIAFIVGSIVRPILVLISYKEPMIINYYYGYSMVMLGIMVLLPIQS